MIKFLISNGNNQLHIHIIGFSRSYLVGLNYNGIIKYSNINTCIRGLDLYNNDQVYVFYEDKW